MLQSFWTTVWQFPKKENIHFILYRHSTCEIYEQKTLKTISAKRLLNEFHSTCIYRGKTNKLKTSKKQIGKQSHQVLQQFQS